MEPGTRLRRRIEQEGPLGFEAWMEACLYGPDGYYMGPARRTGIDDDADYATSPTMHPFMGEAVAKEAHGLWERLGRPDAFGVVEHGGGEGDLARAALAWADREAPAFAAALGWSHVEASPRHQRSQTSGDPRIGAAVSTPGLKAGLVLAHEFVDALPFHVLERHGEGWQELRVDHDGERFVEAFGPPSAAAMEAAPSGTFAEGQRVVAMARAKGWLQACARRLGRGGVLVIDYGDEGRHLWTPERPDATVRGFSGHRLVENVLERPGEVDITASVDFTALRRWGQEAGLVEAAYELQESFLMRHGVLEALNAQDRSTREGAGRYLRLRQMLLPQGMGHAFRIQRFECGMDGI